MFEVSEVSRFERQVRAMVAAADDPESCAVVARILGEAQRGMVVSAACLRARTANGTRGYSWADLAAPLGVSRQAVAKRYS